LDGDRRIMAKCKKCGLDVYPGNSRRVGKKQREHVSCEKAKEKQARTGSLDEVKTREAQQSQKSSPSKIVETSEPQQAQKEPVKPVLVKQASLNIKKQASPSRRKNQMFNYRLFVRKYDAERLNGAVKPLRIEVIPVLSSEVENNPEGLNEYTEITLEG
jgi:hypothetical protein